MAYTLLTFLCCGIGLYAYVKGKNGKRWGNSVAALFCFLTILFAVASVIEVLNRPKQKLKVLINQYEHQEQLTMQYIGDYLGANFPGRRILLITVPETDRTRSLHAARLRGLETGLDGKLTIAAKEYATGKSFGTPPADAGHFTARDLNNILQSHHDCDLVLCLADLPEDVKNLQLWSLPPAQRPVVVTAFADVYELGWYIETGAIAAAVVNLRKRAPEASADAEPENFTSVFRRNCLLVTPENIGSIAGLRPNLFRPWSYGSSE